MAYELSSCVAEERCERLQASPSRASPGGSGASGARLKLNKPTLKCSVGYRRHSFNGQWLGNEVAGACHAGLCKAPSEGVPVQPCRQAFLGQRSVIPCGDPLPLKGRGGDGRGLCETGMILKPRRGKVPSNRGRTIRSCELDSRYIRLLLRAFSEKNSSARYRFSNYLESLILWKTFYVKL